MRILTTTILACLLLPVQPGQQAQLMNEPLARRSAYRAAVRQIEDDYCREWTTLCAGAPDEEKLALFSDSVRRYRIALRIVREHFGVED